MLYEDVRDAFPEFQFENTHPRPGGSKQVYFVSSDGQPCVLKIYHEPIPPDAESQDEAPDEVFVRIQREIEVTRALDHPSIVKPLTPPEIRTVGDADHLWYLEPRFEGTLDDPQLASRFRGNGVTPLVRTLLDAVEVCHSEQFIHRDIKPANIAVDQNGCIILIDFGAVYLSGANRITVTGDLGPRTPEYAAPEQFDITAQPDQRTDLFQIGICAWVVATDSHPFSRGANARTAPIAYLDVVRQGVDVATLTAVGVDARTAAVICRCLGFNPAERYRTAEQARKDLGD